MVVGINLLQKLNITVDQVNEAARILQESLGDKTFLRAFERKSELSLGDLQLLLNRAAIVGQLSSKVGFNRVVKEINADPNSSLSIPTGSWFQLKVGFIVNLLGEELAFEQKVGRSPKDILLRDGHIQIECKSFLLSPKVKELYSEHGKVFLAVSERHPIGKWKITIKRELNDGTPLNDLINIFQSTSLEDLLQGEGSCEWVDITKWDDYEPIGSVPPGEEFPTLAIAGIEHTTETLRTPISIIGNDKLAIQMSGPQLDRLPQIEQAIIDKKPQMIEGICNIIALGIDNYVGDIGILRAKLSKFFIPQQDNAISGLLIILHEQETEAGKPIIKLELLENHYAQVKIPTDLLEKFRGGYSTTVERSS